MARTYSLQDGGCATEPTSAHLGHDLADQEENEPRSATRHLLLDEFEHIVDALLNSIRVGTHLANLQPLDIEPAR